MPGNSSCNNYTWRHLNYSGDVDLMQQLEYDAINYINSNISNHYCRNYLRAALCATLYPPCNENGDNVTVQRLCPDECNSLLNSSSCLQVTTGLANIMWRNVSVNFIINCANSVEFATSLSDVLTDTVNYSENCTSIVNNESPPGT